MKNGAIINFCENKTIDNLIWSGKAYAPILSRLRPVKGSAAIGFGREYCDPPEWKIHSILSVHSHRFARSANSDLFAVSVEVKIYVSTILSVIGDWSSRCKSDGDDPVSWLLEIFLKVN